MAKKSPQSIPVTLLFYPAEEGGFYVRSPELPGLNTEGDTFEEAMSMAQEAVEGYLECIREDDTVLPNRSPMIFTIQISTNRPHASPTRRLRHKTPQGAFA